jgi:hypothetical protein
MARRILLWTVAAIGAIALVAGLGVGLIVSGLLGDHQGPGEIVKTPIPPEIVSARAATQKSAATAIGVGAEKQILFGDLHVHTTFSPDAFQTSLPLLQGDGAHPPADACDFARFCSALDFWSITDHAEGITEAHWKETKDAIRQCNAVAGEPANPDVVAFLGWEWTQIGPTRETHYGHKNVIFRDLGDDQVPARPIASAGLARNLFASRGTLARILPPLLDFRHREEYFDFDYFAREVSAQPPCQEGVPTRELPTSCSETAATPADLFAKLDEWGFDALVIPHGTTWGFYTPPGSSWDKQLVGAQHDPTRQTLIEIYSGHGNSEEYRHWREVQLASDGSASCPEPNDDYLPSCWRAGEIIRARCDAAGLPAEECEQRGADARQNYVNANISGHRTVPGAETADWLDSGQCKDCFLPSFNFRPKSSVQYIEALTNFDDPNDPRRFRLGFIASSDVHSARPGTGFKEFGRLANTEARGPVDSRWQRTLLGRTVEPEPKSVPFTPGSGPQGFGLLEFERQASFFLTGGLAAAHSTGRDRESIWDALQRREVYGTSGDRILLWFDLLNGPGGARVPMGGEVKLNDAPSFEVRAVGALRQAPGCPDSSARALGPERLERLCREECYNPTDERKLITRIEVVRIRPQVTPGEDVGELIEDPWLVHACPADPAGCTFRFEDPDHATAGRDALYYVRAVEEASKAVNAANLRCAYDGDGNCVSVRPCWGDYRTDDGDDCLAETEERAWSSPIYVDRQD